MRWPVLAISIFALFANSAVGGTVHAAEELVTGQVAPYAGALIEASKVPPLVEELRAARRAIAETETLRDTVTAQAAQIEALTAQAQALEGANDRLQSALRIAEEIEALRQKQKDVALLVFERYDRALKQADEALDRAQSRIDALERRALWSQVLSVIGPLAILVLMVL